MFVWLPPSSNRITLETGSVFLLFAFLLRGIFCSFLAQSSDSGINPGGYQEKPAAGLISTAGSWSLREVRTAETLALWGGEPASPSWKAPGLPRTLPPSCRELRPSELQVLLESSRKCEVGESRKRRPSSALCGSPLSPPCIFWLGVVRPLPEPGGLQLERVTSASPLGPIWRD